MLKRAVLLLLAAVPITASAAFESYTLDPEHTYPYFSVVHSGYATVFGRFNKTSGKFTIDRAAKSATIELNIEAASADTGHQDRHGRPMTRDEMLRGADWFNAAEFPRISFKSTRVGFDGDRPASIEGSLTLLGVTKPVTLKVDRFACGPYFRNTFRCGGLASGVIKRSDFGMKGNPSVSDEVQLMIGFEGEKDAS